MTKKERIGVPTVGIDGVHHAIRALFAYKKPAFYKDIASAANLNPVYMSASLSTARNIGLTKLAGKRGLYELTKEGEQYARLISFGKDSNCRDLLQKIILEGILWSEIVAFLRISKGQAREPMDLVLDVEEKLGKKWSSSLRGKISKNYASILNYAGLVKLEKGKMISQIGIEPEEIKGDSFRPKTITPSTSSISHVEFAEFSLPDSFILYVRKDLDAIEFFEKQVKEDSVFASWIKLIRNKLSDIN